MDSARLGHPIWIKGVVAAFGIPGFSIFGTMAGFAAIAREAGFDLSMAMAATVLVWGMPGQVAMASVHAAGATMLALFTAVALANMRMLMMTVSGMGMMRMNGPGVPFWRKLFAAQMMAVTSWVQVGSLEGRLDRNQLVQYYWFFASTIYLIGMAGVPAGYFLSDWVSEEVLLAVLVLTPLYMLMMVINASRMLNRIAVVAGGTLCPLLYPLLGEWSILVGGTVAGTLVFAAHRHWSSKGGA